MTIINPSFFIVGAAKAGTTSIYKFLEQHPDVYMSPIKEPHYFSKDIRCKDFVQSYRKFVCSDINKYFEKTQLEKRHIAFIENRSDYLQLFRDIKEEKISGEISTGYLYSKVAAKEICKFNPNAKVIMILRDPVERAFSHWLMDLRGEDVCRKSFTDAIADDQKKMSKGWGQSHLYIELGQYYEQVKRYLDVFPKDQVLIMLYDELVDNQTNFLNRIFEFLNIKLIDIDTRKKHNIASIPKYPVFNLILKKIKLNCIASFFLSNSLKAKIKTLLPKSDALPQLTHTDKQYIAAYFDDDIKPLEKLINKDLSNWFKNCLFHK